MGFWTNTKLSTSLSLENRDILNVGPTGSRKKEIVRFSLLNPDSNAPSDLSGLPNFAWP